MTITRKRMMLIASAAWLIIGSLTGGYYYNHRMTCSYITDKIVLCEEPIAVLLVAIWPVYWLGRAAVAITK